MLPGGNSEVLSVFVRSFLVMICSQVLGSGFLIHQYSQVSPIPASTNVNPVMRIMSRVVVH